MTIELEDCWIHPDILKQLDFTKDGSYDVLFKGDNVILKEYSVKEIQ